MRPAIRLFALFILALLALTKPAHAEEAPSAAKPAAQPRAHLAPDLAFADRSDPDPGSPKGLLIAGWTGVALSVASIAQLSLCSQNDYEGSFDQTSCARTAIALSAVGVAVGVPFLVWGYRRRAQRVSWRARHGFAARTGPAVAGLRAGAMLSYRVAF